MTRFLIHRPIATLGSALAIAIIGMVASQWLPVSLMPDVEIPEITVQVNGKNQSARELEDAVVGPLRRELLQVPKLEDIQSQSRDGVGIIRMKFAFGTAIDYAFLDVNKQVDEAMSRLPRDTERPHVIKASATDLPVFFLNLSLKDSLAGEDRFLELSEFGEEVIRKRLEQLPEIALVDITGRAFPEVRILPDQSLMQSLGVSQEMIQQALEQNNVHLGNLLVQDGQYQYNIRFASYVRSSQDIGEIYLNVNDKLIQLKEIASISLQPQARKGAYLSNIKPALGLAIIKQSDARMESLKNAVQDLMTQFESDYPDIQFTLSQDQTLTA